MRKGFTLIELLAVIVILAIIALIATPIILGIINDAREKANERSVELYASAVRNAVAAYQLTGTKAPESFADLDIQYDGKVECATEELYEDGSFYIADCTVNGGTKEYSYGTKQVKAVYLSDVCTPVTETTKTTGNVPMGTYTLGDEYTCEVKEGVSYTFFILSKVENKVNLIMDSNITEDGTPLKQESLIDNSEVDWLSSDDYKQAGGNATDEILNGPACLYDGICIDNSYGPITATNYLNEWTSSWTNVPILNEQYDDEGNHFTEFTLVGRARMPKLSEVEMAGCIYYKKGTCPLWMINYSEKRDDDNYLLKNSVSGVFGYLILSSHPNSNGYAYYVDLYGGLNVSYNGKGGLRPVITLSI